MGVAAETVFGTPVPATNFLPDTQCTLEVDPGWFSPSVMMGQRDLQTFNLYGEQKIAGTVEGPLFPSNGIPLLVYAIGTDAVTGSGTPYTHTISQANALKSVTVEKNIGGYQSLQFAGCRVGKIALKCAAGNEAATITADIAGQKAAVMDTPTGITIVNEAPFTFANGTLTLFSHARTEVTSCTVDIDNGLKETYTFSGQHYPSFITPVTLKVSGTVDVVWDSLDDSTYGDYTTMENGTLGALVLALSQGVDASVTVNVPQIALSKYSNDLKVSDVIMSSLTYEGSRDLSNPGTVTAVIVNSVATAY